MGMDVDLRFFRFACLLGLVGVAAGAFAAHGLRDVLPPARLDTFQTAVRYQLLHVPVLLVIAILRARTRRRALEAAGWLFTAGIGIFSGSLYLLVLLDRPVLGAITPVGGVCLLAGWLVLGLSASARAGA
jgi:uncharacterized membrane protein YgdD (TMEM256/DUF423 family)